MNVDLEELVKQRAHEEAVAIERVHFTKTDRRVNPRKENPFLYLPGKIPLLVSVPHAVRYLKGKKICVSDEFTGSAGYLLHKLTNCYVVAHSKFYNGDPSSDNPCIYKDFLQEVITQNRIKYVLDLLGAPRDYSADLDLAYYSEVWQKAKTSPEVLAQQLQADILQQVSLNHFPLGHEYSVTQFVSQALKIPALQVRLNRKFRAPNRSGPAFCRGIAGLAKLIDHLV